ncbi:hypothetical protein FXO38_06462 [Capsicum annuum]|nr:hypothetical protein FXO38_06462 [Capsicum annuum]KAF3674186.1 hypothetical protein FXO37_06527 [Capsicum annuum]
MEHNECNNQLRVTLHDVFGLKDSDSLHGNEDSYGGCADGPDQYLDTNDEDLQNLADEEMNSRLTDFGVVKKNAKKLASQLKYVTVGYDKCRKTTVRNQSKRVDCKARVNCKVINDYSCIVTKVILEHNHELDPALSYFLPSHRELSRVMKKSLVAHDIAGLRPSKSIRLLEVEDGGSERMSCTPKECRNYILQQRRLRTLSSNVTALHRFFVDMHSKDKIFFIQ